MNTSNIITNKLSIVPADTNVVNTVKEKNLQTQKNKLIAKDVVENGFMKDRHFYNGKVIHPDDINALFSDSSLDMEVINNAQTLLDAQIDETVAYIKSLNNTLTTQIKKVGAILDKVGVVSSTIDNGISSVVETFVSKDDVVSGDLHVDIYDGTLTLPVKSSTSINLAESTNAILPDSDGVFDPDNTLSNVFDGQDLTYGYYYNESGANKLTLNLLITLPTASITNNIQIHPNNFNFTNWITLNSLQISSDGITYSPIIDEPQLLSSNDTKYNNYVSLNYKPTQTKSIKIGLVQYNKNIINQRYEIGLSSVKLNKISYSSTGELILKKNIPLVKLNTLALHLQDIYPQTKVFSNNFQISLDGSKYYDIQPVEYSGSTTEILYVNQPWLTGSIATDKPDIATVYIKATLKKELLLEELKKLLNYNIAKTSKVSKFPTQAPYTILFENTIDNKSLTLDLLTKLSTGRENSNKYVIGTTNTTDSLYRHHLPFNTHGLEVIKIGDVVLNKYNSFDDLLSPGYCIEDVSNIIHIKFNPKQIPYVETKNYIDPWLINTPIPETTTVTTPTDDPPLSAQNIILYLLRDTITKPTSNILKTKFIMDGDKSTVRVWKTRLDTDGNIITNTITDIIPANTTSIKLSFKPIKGNTSIIGGYELDYINGAAEFRKPVATGYAYSVDYEKSTLYLSSLYSVDIGIQYKSLDQTEIDSDLFQIGEDNQSIIINSWIFNSDYEYALEYNVVTRIDSSMYSVSTDNKSVALTSNAIVEEYLGNFIISDMELKATYSYVLDDVSFMNAAYECLSPVIDELKIKYGKFVI